MTHSTAHLITANDVTRSGLLDHFGQLTDIASHRAVSERVTQIEFAQPQGENMRAKMGSQARAQVADMLFLPSDQPAIKLFMADMDSTMIGQECIDELADFVGKKAEVSAITERAMNGELDFETALTERVALLAGLEEATLIRCFDERITLMRGAKELVAGMKSGGARTALVSGGFTFFTERVAALLGFDEHHGNQLEIIDGQLTGRVIQPILGKEAKLEQLNRLIGKLGISADEVLAIGDGANDVPMLIAAGIGVAYRAKPAVQQQATHRLNFHAMDVLLELLGLSSIGTSAKG